MTSLPRMLREGLHQEDVCRAECTTFLCYRIVGMNFVELEDVCQCPIMLVFHGVT